jgi:hypothetical protein
MGGDTLKKLRYKDINPKKMRVGFLDWGLFSDWCAKVASFFGDNIYCVPWEGPFPTSDKRMIGEGVSPLKRVDDWEDWEGKCDLYVFPDLYTASKQRNYREKGFRVWGCGDSEKVEINREFLKEQLERVGLPVIPWRPVKGCDKMKAWIKANPEDCVLKSSCFRGDIETFIHKKALLKQTMQWIDKRASIVSVKRDRVVFLVEPFIPGVEPGYDGGVVAGPDTEYDGYWNNAGIGMEVKGDAIIERVFARDKMPSIMANVNKKMLKIFEELGCQGPYSWEGRIPEKDFELEFDGKLYKFKKGEIYYNDATMRLPSPPTELMTEHITNWGEVVWDMAEGLEPNVEYEGEYGVELKLHSSWLTEDSDLQIKIPEEDRRFIKIRNHYVDESGDYSISQDRTENAGAVIAIGDDLEKCMAEALERASRVEAYRLEYDRAAFDEAKKYLKEVEEWIKF